MSRLLLVSNRLPVTIREAGEGVEVVPSSGGLATGLQGHHDRSGGLWLGWPGDVSKLSEPQRQALEQKLEERRIVPIYLTSQEIARYYEGFSNKLLWPLFHHMTDRIPLHSRDWGTYVKVNERFAEAIVSRYQPGDTIWVHDLHLMLVPGLLRQRLPDAAIGFFLHIPFPPSEVFRALPWRIPLLEGVLGADLIGFHTLPYQRHFASALLELLGVDTEHDRVRLPGRQVRLGAFPIGVDAAGFDALAQSESVLQEAQMLRESAKGQRLLVGVERLDYTKGIRRRMLAIDRLLERRPELRGKVRFVQLAVPSREGIDEYAKLRRQVDELVGQINARHGDAYSVPIHYLYRSVAKEHLVALYRAAEVMVVTPLRDGMNLVAKEFVASRNDGDGVLVLSEFAGAAQELSDALIVNPYDIEQLATVVEQALEMPEEERRLRMQALRKRVFDFDIHKWVESFLECLKEATASRLQTEYHISSNEALDSIAQRIRSAPHVQLLLDYDGTLIPYSKHAELAVPDADLRALLQRLAERPGMSVQIVSGRPHAFLDKHFGQLGVGLHGEHGLWSRRNGEWAALQGVSWDWKPEVHRVLTEYTRRVPGSFIEEKTATLAWHYRRADVHLARSHATKLHARLNQMLNDLPVDVVFGNMVLEVRPRGVHKGRIIQGAQNGTAQNGTPSAPNGTLWVALGDDVTDEDMFGHLPPDGIAIRVGPGPSSAPYRLRDVQSVRRFLSSLLG